MGNLSLQFSMSFTSAVHLMPLEEQMAYYVRQGEKKRFLQSRRWTALGGVEGVVWIRESVFGSANQDVTREDSFFMGFPDSGTLFHSFSPGVVLPDSIDRLCKTAQSSLQSTTDQVK